MAVAGTDGLPDRWPVELDRTIELVREAFIQAMRDEGVSPRTRITISARAELNIHQALEDDAEENPSTQARRLRSD